jgi:GNAT superfamily N-acetyltransferase
MTVGMGEEEIAYGVEPNLAVAEFRQVLERSGLGAARPVEDAPRLARMLAAADLLVTARRRGRLVGVARALTDFAWCCYVSELAVCRSAQGSGIGRGLLDQVRRRLGPEVGVFLMATPDAVAFYDRIGMPRAPGCFRYPRER